MVKYAWFFGRVAVLVEYFEQIGPDEIEGGARLEVRRVEKELVRGAAAAVPSGGAEGFVKGSLTSPFVMARLTTCPSQLCPRRRRIRRGPFQVPDR